MHALAVIAEIIGWIVLTLAVMFALGWVLDILLIRLSDYQKAHIFDGVLGFMVIAATGVLISVAIAKSHGWDW